MRPIEVLLIEDNPADVKLIQEGLNRSCPDYRLSVRIAADGEQALAMLLRSGEAPPAATTYRPDMILLDLNLPKMDGRTVLDHIRSQGFDMNTVPVVIFSSSAHGIQEALNAGANAYIIKPSGLADYMRAIERFAILWLKPQAEAAGG